MSWNDYVSRLEASNGVQKAAIMGLDGSCWAISEGWSVSQQEALALVKGFVNSEILQASGVNVGGNKYFFIGSTDTFIRGKKGQSGIHVAKTNQTLIIGFYDDTIQPGVCTTEVEKTADYLKSLNY